MQKVWIKDTMVHRKNPFRKIGNNNYLRRISIHAQENTTHKRHIIQDQQCDGDNSEICLSDSPDEEIPIKKTI